MKFLANRQDTAPAEIQGMFGGEGLFRRWSYYGETEAPPFTVIGETEMAPGARAGLHTQPDQQELLYILEGRGEFMIDGETRPVKAGDAILARAGSNFALANTSAEPLRYLVVKCRTTEATEASASFRVPGYQ